MVAVAVAGTSRRRNPQRPTPAMFIGGAPLLFVPLRMRFRSLNSREVSLCNNFVMRKWRISSSYSSYFLKPAWRAIRRRREVVVVVAALVNRDNGIGRGRTKPFTEASE